MNMTISSAKYRSFSLGLNGLIVFGQSTDLIPFSAYVCNDMDFLLYYMDRRWPIIHTPITYRNDYML